MPIYEYKCEECNNDFESLRKYDERYDANKCPVCFSDKTGLVVSTPRIDTSGCPGERIKRDNKANRRRGK